MTNGAKPQPFDGFNAALDLEIVSASSEQVVIAWQVADKHRQPMGLVHGGVLCGAVESACSIGASLSAMTKDPHMVAVGLENQTSFLRASRAGRLRAIARPLSAGRTTQVWQADVVDDDDVLIASGRVRLLCVARDASLGAPRLTTQEPGVRPDQEE